MKRSSLFVRWLSLLLAAVFALSGCGAVSDLVAPYEEELGELGNALLDQLLEADTGATADPETSPSPASTASPETTTAPETTAAPVIDKNGSYTTKEDVALYLRTYGELPPNFITKTEAQALGWVSNKGNLHDVAPGKSIGGDYFGNYEGLLPKKTGRQYYECDIDYTGGFRGAKRIVYSNDGLIYYTENHYESFTEITNG